MFNANGKSISQTSTSANLSSWGKKYAQFLEQKYKDGTINVSTEWNKVQNMWTEHISFEVMGEKCFNDNKFPEATFWYFQHKTHKLDGAEYKNVDLAHSKCEKEWEELVSYLKEKDAEKFLTSFITWSQINILYKNRTESLSTNYSFIERMINE